MHRQNLSKYIQEMEEAANEQKTPMPEAANPSAEPFAWLYFLVALPFLGGILVAVECRVVFGMYQLFALAFGVAFTCWAFRRRPSTAGLLTFEQAWRLASQVTSLLGAVPLAACLVFLVIDRLFGVFWGYVVAGIAVFMCVGAVEGRFRPAPVPNEEPERGKKQGGIDEKLREEYERARRQQMGLD
jgi:hypothetical protein